MGGKGFVKGQSGNPGGRPAGVQNKATVELKEFWGSFFGSASYRQNLKRRMLAGKAPQMELYLHALIYGRPEQTIQFRGEVARPLLGVGLVAPEVIDVGRSDGKKETVR